LFAFKTLNLVQRPLNADAVAAGPIGRCRRAGENQTSPFQFFLNIHKHKFELRFSKK